MSRNPNRYSISPRSGRLRKRIPARDHRSFFVRVRDDNRLSRLFSFLLVLVFMIFTLYGALRYFGSADIMLRKPQSKNGKK
jgi:hypothetical protein